MTAICLGVLLAFMIQYCWVKGVEKRKTEKILFMVYTESMSNINVYNNLYNNYSKMNITTFNQMKLNTDFAKEFLYQSNKQKYIDNPDISVINLYIRLADQINDSTSDYFTYLLQTNFTKSEGNNNLRKYITNNLVDFVGSVILVQEMTVQYDIDRDNNYQKRIAEIDSLRKKYKKAILQGKIPSYKK